MQQPSALGAHLAAPVDRASAARLALDDLRYDLVDLADDEAIGAWLRATTRGFHAPSPEAAGAEARLAFARQQRLTGVWRAGDAPADEPVATVNSWPQELTMPGGGTLPMWAVSSVTVAPTHSGRGIARALVEGELRTAAALGFAVSGLTVTESTLYERYGYGIAAEGADLEIDTRRVRWRGPATGGELAFVPLADAAGVLEEVHDAARRTSPGDVSTLDGFWHRVTGARTPDDADTRARRFVRYTDAAGAVTGALQHAVSDDANDVTRHVLEVQYLAAATDEAAAALWRFVLAVPLVATVKAPLRAVDDPVRWMVGDHRAVRATTRDHHWLRILDVPAALGAREYGASGALAISVRDELGFASGDWLLETGPDGRGRARRIEGAGAPARDDAPRLELDAAHLASLWLGGVRPDALARAGRIGASEPAGIAVADRVFHSPRAPWLSTWY